MRSDAPKIDRTAIDNIKILIRKIPLITIHEQYMFTELNQAIQTLKHRVETFSRDATPFIYDVRRLTLNVAKNLDNVIKKLRKSKECMSKTCKKEDKSNGVIPLSEIIEGDENETNTDLPNPTKLTDIPNPTEPDALAKTVLRNPTKPDDPTNPTNPTKPDDPLGKTEIPEIIQKKILDDLQNNGIDQKTSRYEELKQYAFQAYNNGIKKIRTNLPRRDGMIGIAAGVGAALATAVIANEAGVMPKSISQYIPSSDYTFKAASAVGSAIYNNIPTMSGMSTITSIGSAMSRVGTSIGSVLGWGNKKGGYVTYKDIWSAEFKKNNRYSSLCLSVNNLSYVIELIEESNNNNATLKLTSFVSINNTMEEINNRKQLRVLNILDMNIVPFDVHSLMKEVPFANLINYSYTFDRLATELILPDWFRYKVGGRKNDIIKITDFSNVDAINNNEALLLSIIYPHQSYDMSFITKLQSFITDNERVGNFGKPAYISDQLFSKVLLDLEYSEDSQGIENLKALVERFNTKLFRNLLWIAQLQRLMKASMISYLSHVESPVVTGLDIADPIITEYTRKGQQYDEGVFQGIRDRLI